MALDLSMTSKAHKIKIETSSLKNKSESIDPWDRPLSEKKQINDKSASESLTIKKESVSNALVTKEESVSSPSVERKQSVSNALVTKKESVSSPLVERKQTVSKALVIKEESVSGPLVERKQSVSNALASPLVIKIETTSISNLSKQQDLLINYIFEICLTLGQRESSKIQNYLLQNYLNTSQGNLRVLILSLKNKGFISVIMSKNGPSGWRIYQLPDCIYKELLSRRNSERALVERKQSVSNALASPLVNASSSSSSLITTTTEPKINTSLLTITSELTLLGFTKGHMEQLLRDSDLSPEEIQNSLNAIAYDLGHEDVKRKIRNPIAMAMKLLKSNQPYISEKGYESEEDRFMREMLERSEKKIVEKKKIQERFFEIKFEEWLDDLTDEDKMKIKEPVGEFMGLLHKNELKNYFKKEIFNANNI